MVSIDAAERLFALVGKKFPEQKDFAAAIGVSAKTVSTWRTGRNKSYVKYLPQIAATLGTTTEYILTGAEKSPASDEAERPECWDLLTREEREKAREYIEMLIAARGKR